MHDRRHIARLIRDAALVASDRGMHTLAEELMRRARMVVRGLAS